MFFFVIAECHTMKREVLSSNDVVAELENYFDVFMIIFLLITNVTIINYSFCCS